ncbi:MAG: hypothetical protein QME62_04915 [Armatimonadota bacterium]|nr:hypothetical protein [Armatimonadota bacterium]
MLRWFALLILITEGVITMTHADLQIRQIPGQAELGTVEILGVGCGEFRPELWEKESLNFVPDIRHPLIEPKKRGLFRNIYAPSAVEIPEGWRIFYGAWDGVESGNDRIYSVFTQDFLDFDNRQKVIEHGRFIHVCNVSAIRLPNGEYRLMCTAYPDKKKLNKPVTFHSYDGVHWNGRPSPYKARYSDFISIEGYDKYADADINGMNVLLYEDKLFRLYFNNFRDFGKVYRATSEDGKHFKFDGPVLEIPAVVNDVKKLVLGGQTYYLMALHMNTDKLWYSLSRDGMSFEPAKILARNLGDADRYIVAVGWVVKDKRVLGFLYGAGAVPGLNRNRIFARWLQKKVVFIAEDGTKYEPSGALGPDRAIINVPMDKQIKGHFVVYDDDGSKVILDNVPTTLTSGAVYIIENDSPA